MKTCYQFYVISECGCADSYYPKEGEAFPDVTHSCDPTNIVEGEGISVLSLAIRSTKNHLFGMV